MSERLSDAVHHTEGRGELDIPLARRVFVNRNLKIETIRMIGFDMDHTLAVYNKLPFETVAYEATRDKLIRDRDYPASIAALQYVPDLIIRGLVVDKRLGNILKIDQYNYVVRAYHGTRPLSKEQRRHRYREHRIRLASDRYMSIDTLFGLPEATLFMQLVDHFDLVQGGSWHNYTRIHDDVRASIDQAHADDTIKRQIMVNPAAYLNVDADLPRALAAFRARGKKLFLLTNSEAHYTQAIMSALLDGKLASHPTWRDYFDIVVVSAGKPGFFTSDKPLRPLAEAELAMAGMQPHPNPVRTSGGTRALEDASGVHGDEILYIGDHTFGDILRAKKRSRWRTAMVIEELAHELDQEHAELGALRELDAMLARRKRLEFELDRLRRATPPEATERVEQLSSELADLKSGIRQRDQEIEGRFNRYWGKLFKCGEITSHFGSQVKDFACVYTSAVRNFLDYPEDMYFRSPREIMPHEMGLERWQGF